PLHALPARDPQPSDRGHQASRMLTGQHHSPYRLLARRDDRVCRVQVHVHHLAIFLSLHIPNICTNSYICRISAKGVTFVPPFRTSSDGRNLIEKVQESITRSLDKSNICTNMYACRI